MNMKSKLMIIAITPVLFLVGCQNSSQSTLPAGVTHASSRGPGDGGGGDTCNGKMIESYKVDITTLPEFKKFIAPILVKMNPSEKDKAPFDFTAKLKTWYLIDCKLKDIPAERKGLFLESYQTAVHTSKEIFIDAKSYRAMVDEEKAKLLLHELIMSFYLIKYMSVKDLCKVSESCSGDYEVVSNWKMFRPETYRPLNSDDHQNIRAVTTWLWENRNSVTGDTFAKIAKQYDFDKRFQKVGHVPTREIVIEANTLLRMLKRYQWAGQFPQFCQFDPNTVISRSTCQTTVEADIRDYLVDGKAITKQIYLKLKIKRNSDQKEFAADFFYPLPPDQKIKTGLSTMGNVLNMVTISMLSQWPGYPGVEPKEGLKSKMAMIMLNMADFENPEIYQLVMQSYVWYSFEDEVAVTNGIKMKTTYGYLTTLAEESENLFVENELPFKIQSFMKSRAFVRSVVIP
ncbi:MAG: hypothetical protein H7061_03530 [Bdellovibrionaceae bacterium]|nr:hypothetical protein [Bdellovibrio sp.]